MCGSVIVHYLHFQGYKHKMDSYKPSVCNSTTKVVRSICLFTNPEDRGHHFALVGLYNLLITRVDGEFTAAFLLRSEGCCGFEAPVRHEMIQKIPEGLFSWKRALVMYEWFKMELC